MSFNKKINCESSKSQIHPQGFSAGQSLNEIDLEEFKDDQNINEPIDEGFLTKFCGFFRKAYEEYLKEEDAKMSFISQNRKNEIQIMKLNIIGVWTIYLNIFLFL